MRVWRQRLWLLLFLLPCLSLSEATLAVQAEVHVFWSGGCPHCEHALAFLEHLAQTTPGVRIVRHEVSGNPQNLHRLTELARQHRIDQPRVPFIVLGDEVFVGYQDDATTGQMLKSRIEACLRTGCVTRLEDASPPPANPAGKAALPGSIRLPLVGDIDLRQLSFPVLTIVLAAADGFNPCAMWVLVFLIGLSLGIQSRSRRWMLGGTFILASAFVYYLILAAWLNTLLLLGAVFWLRTGIAVLALGMGIWSLWEGFKNEQTCKVTAAPARRAILNKLRDLALSASLPLALIGITLLAFAINIVEMLCSAGIPAVYTQYLAMSPLPAWQHYSFIGLYVLVFMANELIVYFFAMLTLEVRDVGQRFTRWSKLIGGVVMLILGLLMLLKPEWLM